jgi:hypothetical protein
VPRARAPVVGEYRDDWMESIVVDDWPAVDEDIARPVTGEVV